jgi:GcrA cell cycle regulator
MAKHNVPWCEERVALLRRLWTDGLTAAQIAARLGGVTRQAVLGKVDRLGLEPRKPPTARERNVTRRRQAANPRPSLAAVTGGRTAFRFASPGRKFNADPPRSAVLPGLPPAPTSEPIDIAALTSKSCHWPIDPADGHGWRFCGAEVGARDSRRRYCDHHHFRELEPSARRGAGF